MSEFWITLLITALMGVLMSVAALTFLRGRETPAQRRRRERWELAREKLRPFDDRHATASHSRQFLVTTKFEDDSDSTVANTWCSTCGDAEIVVVTDKDVDDDRARRAVVA